MKIIFISLVTLLSTCLLLAGSDTLNNQKHYDTPLIKNNDSAFVTIVKYPKQNWFEKNEGNIVGALVGSFFAGIIAVISVYLTSQANKKLRLLKEKEIYCGFLYSTKIELIYHSKNHSKLVEELKVIQHNSLIASEVITDAPSSNISLSFLKELRSKIVDTELFNTKILLFLSDYINKCELVNNDIQFERLIKVSEKFKEQIDFQSSIKSYFDIVIKEVENLIKSIPDAIQLINDDLALMGKPSEIDESKYLKIAS